MFTPSVYVETFLFVWVMLGFSVTVDFIQTKKSFASVGVTLCCFCCPIFQLNWLLGSSYKV